MTEVMMERRMERFTMEGVMVMDVLVLLELTIVWTCTSRRRSMACRKETKNT